MKVPRYVGKRWDAAERQARVMARQGVAAAHGKGQNVHDLRARIDRLEQAFGLVK